MTGASAAREPSGFFSCASAISLSTATSSRAVGADDEDAPVRDVRPRGPHLLPVHDPFFAVEFGEGARAAEVGTAARLAETLAPDLVAAQQRLQVARLLLVRPPGDDRGAGHAE